MFPSDQVNNAARREPNKNEPPEITASGVLTVFELSPFSLFTLTGEGKMNRTLLQMACCVALTLLPAMRALGLNCCE